LEKEKPANLAGFPGNDAARVRASITVKGESRLLIPLVIKRRECPGPITRRAAV
jgi:hypothetical protein